MEQEHRCGCADNIAQAIVNVLEVQARRAADMPPPEKLAYSLAEVAELTGVPLPWLQVAVRASRFEHVRGGNYRGMTRGQVDKLLNALMVAAEMTMEEQALAIVRARVARKLASRGTTKKKRRAT